MGSVEGRSKALRRLDERLSEVEGALARHERRLAELHEVRERLLLERAGFAPADDQGEAVAPLPAGEQAGLESAGETLAGGAGGTREHRPRTAGLPREAEPVGRPEDPVASRLPERDPAMLDAVRVWETFSSYREPRGPRVIYGRTVAEEWQVGAPAGPQAGGGAPGTPEPAQLDASAGETSRDEAG